jgi:hypothetical protein
MSDAVRRAVEDAVSELLKEPSAGRVLGVKGNTLRKWRQLGIGPACVKLTSRCVRYRREDLMRFLESRRVTPRNGENV